MSPDRPITSVRRLTRLLIFAVFAAAFLAAIAGCVPFEWIRPLGRLIRRPDDVTPERYARYLQVCWVFAAAFAVAGILLRRYRDGVAASLEGWRSELRERRVSLRSGRRLLGWPLLIVAIGAGLRLWFLDGPIAYDEAYTFLNFARRPWYEAIADYNSPNNHMLNTFLMHWCYRIWGQQEWALRLPVFLAGTGLLPLVYVWSKELFGRDAALVTTALAAVAPALVTYSTDARGYAFVLLFAVTLDGALGRIDAARAFPRLAWTAAWLAMVLGLAAMPIMLYPIAGTVGWFLLAGLRDPARWSRVCSLFVFGATGAVAVAALYAPAYIFRGLMFLSDPVMDPGPAGPWAQVLPGWRAAFEWWTAGFLPPVVWGLGLAAGVLALCRRPRLLVRFVAPFAAVLLLNVTLQKVPPPRVYLFLAPWVFAAFAEGVTAVAGYFSSSRWPARCLAVGVVIGGLSYAATRPVLFDARERSAYVSVEDVVRHLDIATDGGAVPSRLIAPLPVDLPSIFHMERRGFSIPVNGPPQPGEVVWLVTRTGQTPDDTLRDGLVRLEDWSDRLRPWKEERRFETLTLYRSLAEIEAAPSGE